ncbi:hypothetical protein [Bosea sp. MMO-172]|uniref:hypothetical protein n=1 Tax=Bosea sp. MMO-172 TaxID=3127885 RepID=UPI003017E4D8
MRRTPHDSVEESVEQQGAPRPEAVVLAGAAAVSGGVVGFFLAGEIRLAVGVFAAALLGLLAGWWAHGVSAKLLKGGAE